MSHRFGLTGIGFGEQAYIGSIGIFRDGLLEVGLAVDAGC